MSINDDLQKLLIMQTVAIIIAVITSVTSIIVARVSHQTRNEVKNDHSTNLREDLDSIRDAVADVRSSLTHVIKRHDAEFARLWRHLKRKRYYD